MSGYRVKREVLSIPLPISSDKRKDHEEQGDIDSEGNQGWNNQSLVHQMSGMSSLKNKGGDSRQHTFTKPSGDPMTV